VSILRAAQFHEFTGQYLATMPGPVVVVPRWLAQPVAAREVGAALATIAAGGPVPMSELAGPADRVTLADEVGYAILVVMETLWPAERTAFVLHDLLGVLAKEQPGDVIYRVAVNGAPGSPSTTRANSSRSRP
jgi:hypothetical protein